jgi:hypothetical protein
VWRGGGEKISSNSKLFSTVSMSLYREGQKTNSPSFGAVGLLDVHPFKN